MHSTIRGAVKKVNLIPARPSTQRYRHWFSARFKETTRTTERILHLCLYSHGGISKLIHLLGAALTGITVYNSLQSLHITLYKLCSVLLLAANWKKHIHFIRFSLRWNSGTVPSQFSINDCIIFVLGLEHCLLSKLACLGQHLQCSKERLLQTDCVHSYHRIIKS